MGEKLPALTDSIPIAFVKVLGSDLVSHESWRIYMGCTYEDTSKIFCFYFIFTRRQDFCNWCPKTLWGLLRLQHDVQKVQVCFKGTSWRGRNETTDTDFGTTELVPLTDEELDAEDVIVSVKNNETLLDNEVDMMWKNKMVEELILSFCSEGKTF